MMMFRSFVRRLHLQGSKCVRARACACACACVCVCYRRLSGVEHLALVKRAGAGARACVWVRVPKAL